MRDPKRIEPMMDAIMELWKMYPDWRFGQLVVNVLSSDPFYIEDKDALEAFLAIIELRKKGRENGEDKES